MTLSCWSSRCGQCSGTHDLTFCGLFSLIYWGPRSWTRWSVWVPSNTDILQLNLSPLLQNSIFFFFFLLLYNFLLHIQIHIFICIHIHSIIYIHVLRISLFCWKYKLGQINLSLYTADEGSFEHMHHLCYSSVCS